MIKETNWFPNDGTLTEKETNWFPMDETGVAFESVRAWLWLCGDDSNHRLTAED